MFATNLVQGDNILWTKGDAAEVFGEGTIANANKWRDLAYYDGVIYAIAHSQDTDGYPRIYKFDADTGSYLGNMDVSAVWGGDIPLTSLQILDNGEVIAMGCRVASATGAVPIYYWDSVQGVSHELMRATIANGGKRVEMIHYEGTLANGKIYLAAQQCDKITVIPVVNKAVVTDQISYITLTSGTDYVGFAPRVINVTDTTISICSSTKFMTYKLSDGSCLTWADLTGANQEGGNGVAFFEYNNEKYWATVKMGNVSAATLANPCIQVQTYTGLGRWAASGVVQKYCSAANLLPSAERNTSFTTGMAVRLNEDGYNVWACSVNHGIIAYRYVAPVQPMVAKKVRTFDLSSNPGGWPTANSTTLTDYSYTLDGVDYTFALKNVKCNTGYLMLTKTAVLGLPAFADYKLTKVVATNSSGCSTSVQVGVSSSASSADYISGGAAQTWSEKSSSYTYDLTETANNTVYYLYVTNANAQIVTLELTYEKEGVVSEPTFTPTDNEFVGSVDVTLAAVEGASILYSLDGSTPSIAYTGAITLTATTTVKAVAVLGDISSDVAPKIYKMIPSYANLDTLVAAGEPTTDGTKVNVTFENVPIDSFYVTKGNTNGVYVTAGGRAIEIYCYKVPETWEQSGKISGTLTCPWKNFNGTWELCPSDWNGITYTAPVADPYKDEPAKTDDITLTATNLALYSESGVTPIELTADANYRMNAIDLIFNMPSFNIPAGTYPVNASGDNNTILAADGNKAADGYNYNPSNYVEYDQSFNPVPYFIVGGELTVAYNGETMTITGSVTTGHGTTINVNLSGENPFVVDYNITVNTTAAGNFQITSANCTDVLNDGGSFKFDNATKTITLTNCHYTSDTYPLIINQSVNIVLVGENSITSTISATALKFASGDATIGGGGKLTLSCVNTGGADGIYCPGGNLTINECEIYAEGGYGIEGGSTRTLTINPGAKVTAYGPNRGSFTGWGSIVLGEGIQILSPAGAQIADGSVLDAGGSLLKSEVVIGKKETPVAPEGNGLNPYAYALSSEMTSDDVFTIHYSLNNNAVAGRILLMSGDNTKAIALTDEQLWIGTHSVDVLVSEMPEGNRVNWSIEISGNSPAAPVQETRMYSMYCPHGVAVDTNPESEYFGRILATEAMDLVKTKTGYISSGANNGAGIYAFAPDFTQIMNGENAVFNGGLNLQRLLEGNGYAPMRVRISEDGRIFATSCDTNRVAVWELSKDLLTWTPVIAGNNDATDYTIKDADGNFIAGLNASIDLKGQGEDLTLLLYSCDNRGIGYNQAGFRLDEYKLGTATTFEGLPTHITALDGKYGLNATNTCVVYDGEGGYWFGASRGGNAGQPNLAHITAEGVQDFYSESVDYYGGDGILIHNGMLLKGKNRTSATVGNFDVYTLGKDQDGKPTLTLKYAVAANGIGRNLNDFAFDYAENLYAVGNSGEKIIAYAFPYSGVVTTPAAEQYEYIAPMKPANARIFASELNVVKHGDDMEFSFVANIDAYNAAIIFFGEEHNEIARIELLDDVHAGLNTIVMDVTELPGEVGDTFSWAVELQAGGVTALTEFTDASKGIYDFYLPQGIAVDNNVESPFFGRVYISESTNGASDGGCDRTKAQQGGIFVYDAALNELNDENTGYHNDLMGDSRQAFKRIKVGLDGSVYVNKNVAGGTCIYKFNPADLTATPTQITDASLTAINSFCLDGDSVIFVLDNANTTDGGKIVKIQNGIATMLVQDAIWANIDNDLVADGRGGVWVAQHRYSLDAYSALTHVTADGTIDYMVKAGVDASITDMFDKANNLSYRGTLAMNEERDMIAFGGNKKVTLFNVAYDEATGVPTLTKGLQTPELGTNIDGIAFDAVGNLYVMSASTERFYAFGLPMAENISMIPARMTVTKAAPLPKTLAEAVEGKTIRRAVADNEGVFVLAVDANKAPVLVKSDFEGNIVTHFATDFCKVSAAAASEAGCMILSDIALTADGVLIGMNAEHAHTTKVEGTQPIIYKWNADGTGAIWINTDDLVGGNENFAAGNFSNATVDMLAYTGTLANGQLALRAMTQGSGNRSRFGIMTITDGAVSDKTRNQDLTAFTATSGIYFTGAATVGNFVWGAETIAPIEWTPVYTPEALASGATPTVVATMATDYTGINGFSFAAPGIEQWMVIPMDDGAKILDIVNGIDAATVKEELIADALTPAYKYAALVEVDGTWKVMLLRDADLQLLEITSSPATELNQINADLNEVQKVIYRGHMYIIRDGKMFNVNGMKVR